jgi:hypothetical protein
MSDGVGIFIALAVIAIIALLRFLLKRALYAGPSRLSTSGRRLGKCEEHLEILSNERQGTTNTCYVMTLYSKDKLKESLVFEALVRVAKRQPMLRAVIKMVSNPWWLGRNDERYFEIIEQGEIRDMIDLTTSDLSATQWQNEWYDIVVRPVAGLLWRTVLFREEYDTETKNYVNTIIFRTNHCIVDGISGMKFIEQFLCQLNSLSEDPRLIGEGVPTLEPFPSFYEMACSKTRSMSSWKDLCKLLGLSFIYKFVRKPRIHFVLQKQPEKPYPFFMTQASLEVSDLVYKVFSESQTSQIRKVCKSKRTTVTGALLAAAHVALCKLIENVSIIAKKHEFTHLFAINGVRVCKSKPPDDYVGNFLLTEALHIPCDVDGDFWSVARDATKQLQTITGNGEKLSANVAEQFEMFTPREIVDEFHSLTKLRMFTENYISSAGAFTFNDDSASMYKLHECLYYSLPYAFPSFSCSFNTTVNGKMAWVIMCSKFVPHTIEKQFAKLCFDTLLNEVQHE